jgi:hypothetical protein
MKSTTIIDGEKYITINGMTFLQFCNEVNGFDFVPQNHRNASIQMATILEWNKAVIIAGRSD